MTAYSHYSGAGNSFFFIDNRREDFPFLRVTEICKKNGIDGVIFLESSTVASYKMRLINPDGSEAEMCGNGLRCFVKYLQEIGLYKEPLTVETKAGIHEAWLADGENVQARMLPPTSIKWNLGPNFHFLNTGVPHAVLFVDEVDTVNIEEEGPRIRFHPLFLPQGANANFVMLKDRTTLFLRTYERGVERETLACGTGAVASALACAHCFSLTSPLEVIVRSGERLKVFFSPDFKNVEMYGPVRLIKKDTL